VVERWQSIRRRLYELLLLDWAEFSAKAMLTRAIERAAAYQLIGADSWVRTDAEFLEHLERSAIGEAQEVRDLVRRLRCADLYEPILLATSPSLEAYSALNSIESKQELESALVRSAGVRGIKVLTHFILDKGKTEREVSFFSEESGAERTIGRSSRQLLCGLFASTPPPEAERTALSQAYSELLRERGVVDLRTLEDPMGSEIPRQQRLL
jgi:hypothetical protein